jgi:hypothetical protein
VPDAALDRCAVLLAAGMPADALAGVEAALAGRITATKKAELMLAAARTALAASRPSQAAERAVMPRSMFTAQQREWWRIHATFVLLQARLAAGQPPGRLLAACGRGFGLLEEHLGTLGAAELRAHATAHGAELAGLAQRARRERRPGGDRGRLVLHRPGRVTTPSQGRRTPGDDGACSAEVLSSTSPASAGRLAG